MYHDYPYCSTWLEFKGRGGGGLNRCSKAGHWLDTGLSLADQTHSTLSGDLSPLGLGQLHLSVSGRDLMNLRTEKT